MLPVHASAQTAASVTVTGAAQAVVDWVGGGGTFSFADSPPLECIVNGVVNGHTYSSPGLSANCSISGSGSFTNVTCGTGFGSGTAVMTTADTSVSFGFDFTVSSFSGFIEPNPPLEPVGPMGMITLSPTNPQPPSPGAPNEGVCTTGFTFTTQFALDGA